MAEAGVLWVLALGRFVDFCVRACASVPWVLVHRPGEVIAQFEQVAIKSLPIVVGAGLSVGMVAWLQTYRLLAAHGAESTLPSFLAVAMIVELGPLLAGLAGRRPDGRRAGRRAGCRWCRMKRSMLEWRWGATRSRPWCAPRAIACALAVPLLTVLIDAAALLGSLAGELAAGKSTALLFWSKSLVFLRLLDVVPATQKTAVFGLLIGLAGCWTGLAAGSIT